MLVPREARGSWYRSNDRVSMPITVELTLREDARRLEIRTRVDNPARDHRLLVLFPTGIRTDAADVETAFAVERRNFLPADIGDNSECDYVYQPMQNFLDLSDQTSGFALLNKGMREYAVWDDPARTVSLTLFRTYRVYMTANTDLTPEEEAKYPGTNCLGKMEFRYAVYPHAGDWREGNVFHEAYDFKTPIRAIQGPAKRGDLPAHRSFLSVQPAEKILFSALRPSADGQGWILRLCNLEDTPLTARVRFGFPCRSVHKIRMDERGEAEALTLQRRAATVPMRAAEIVTLRLDAPAAGNPAPSRRRRSVTRPGRSPKSR